jgi:glycosyltransferase involved in cell wall biosynthesis
MEKVSIIIPTYNRFKFLLNAIQSVREQTYTNIEIIVINDCSTEKEYYEYDFGKDIKIIHLDKNSKVILGNSSAGHVRNFGINVATGDYIAFLDDDDQWFPKKLELQLMKMKETGCKMSCTAGFFGHGVYDKNKTYKTITSDTDFNVMRYIYSLRDYDIDDGYPEIWNLDFLNIHNCCITSSVIVTKDLVKKVGFMKPIRFGEDYDYWLRVLEHTDCVYVKDVCFYYDLKHGDGINY